MANKKVSVGGAVPLNETANLEIGCAEDMGASAWSIHIVDGGAYSGSILVKARGRGIQADKDSVGYVQTLYRKLWLNGVIGDGSLVGTAITTHSLIIVPSSGLSISLDVTFTSGSAKAYISPVIGSPAI